MASKTPHTIILKGDPQGREHIATAEIVPGSLVTVVPRPAGRTEFDQRIFSVRPTVATDAAAGAQVAREPDIFGGSIDTVYAAEDTVLVSSLRKGDEFYGLLAAGSNVVAGAALTYGAGGTVAALAAPGEDEPAPVAHFRAMSEVNNAAGPDPVRIKVEVL